MTTRNEVILAVLDKCSPVRAWRVRHKRRFASEALAAIRSESTICPFCGANGFWYSRLIITAHSRPYYQPDRLKAHIFNHINSKFSLQYERTNAEPEP